LIESYIENYILKSYIESRDGINNRGDGIIARVSIMTPLNSFAIREANSSDYLWNHLFSNSPFGVCVCVCVFIHT